MNRSFTAAIAAVLLSCLLLIAACAPAPAAPAADTPQPNVEFTAAPEYLTIPPSAVPVQAAASGTVYQRLTAMLPVLDSLVRTMGLSAVTPYAPEDPAFVWNYLYLMGVNQGGTAAGVTTENNAVNVPKPVMEAFLHAAFASLQSLPEQPAPFTEIAAYDGAANVYRLALSDQGSTDVQLDRWYALDDGTVIAVMGLYDADTFLGSLRFTLTKSADAAYPYAVSAALPDNGDSARFQPLNLAEETDLDLDGDGAADAVSFAVGSEDSLDMTIRLANGQTFTENFEYFYNASAHIGSIAPLSGKCELYVCGDMGSDDYETHIYRLENNALINTAVYGSVVELYGDGTALVDGVVNILGTYGSLCRFGLADSEFRLDPVGEYAAAQYDWGMRALTLQKDGLTAADAITGETIALVKGARFLLLGTDAESNARLECEDGKQIILSLELSEDGWSYDIAGESETAWFGELLYAG